MADDLDALRAEYEEKGDLYQRFCTELAKQIGELLRQEGIALAVPIEERVKPWESIVDKCERSKTIPSELHQIPDLAGLRLILLFRRDQEKACELIKANLRVLDVEDALDRLSVDQFGYGSVHFQVRLKKEWLSLPSMREMAGLPAEIQVRTASQHIWAAASHVLQYKRESHVPEPLRRALNRVAALLETVDLEFERVLGERDTYVAELREPSPDEVLNTDILEKILGAEFPAVNLAPSEPYGELLDELGAFGIRDAKSLLELIHRQRDAIFAAEHEQVRKLQALPETELTPFTKARLPSGVFFAHIGLARQALRLEFGIEKLEAYWKGKSSPGTKSLT